MFWLGFCLGAISALLFAIAVIYLVDRKPGTVTVRGEEVPLSDFETSGLP